MNVSLFCLVLPTSEFPFLKFAALESVLRAPIKSHMFLFTCKKDKSMFSKINVPLGQRLSRPLCCVFIRFHHFPVYRKPHKLQKNPFLNDNKLISKPCNGSK